VLIPRHRFYTTLLLFNLLLMVVGIGLPPAQQNLIRPGYMLMGLLLLLGLGGRPPTRLSGWRIYVFPLLGVTTLAVDLLWWVTQLPRFSGLPLLLMWICFAAGGAVRQGAAGELGGAAGRFSRVHAAGSHKRFTDDFAGNGASGQFRQKASPITSCVAAL
jgi:hypothetical protein